MLAGLVLPGLCAPARGASPASMKAQAIVEGVSPGTRLTAAMRSDDVGYDIRDGLGREGELPEAFRIRSAGVLRLDLVVPESGSARPEATEIRFATLPDSVPNGMAALVEFPLRYEIACGSSTPGCRTRKGSPSPSLRAPTTPYSPFSVCLQFRGGPGPGDVFVGIAAICAGPRRGRDAILKR